MTNPVERQIAHLDSLGLFLRGSGVVMAGMMARIVILFITEVIAARILMPERYGLITWGLFLLNMLSMLTGLGLNTAIRRYIPIYEAEQDHQSSSEMIRFSALLSLIAGLLGALLLFAGVGWVARTILGDERETLVLVILALALPLWNLQKAILAIFSGFKLPGYKVVVEDLLVPLGFLFVVVLAWRMNWKEIPIAKGYVVVYLLSVIVGVSLVLTRTPYTGNQSEVQNRGRQTDVPKYRPMEILAFSWPLIFTEPLGKLTGLVDIIIIGALALTYNVGIFRVASDLAVSMSLVLMSFGFMFLPVISRFVASGDKAAWQDMNARVARWSMLVNFPIFATLFFFPEGVINLIYGSPYREAAPVLRILALAYYGHAMVGFTGMNLAAAGLTKAQLMAHLASLVINIGGNILLIPLYGIKGAAVATLLSLWAVNGICLVLMKWRLGFHPFNLKYFKNLAALLIVSTVFAIPLQIRSGISDLGVLVIFLSVLFGFAAALYRLGFFTDATDRDVMQLLFKRRFLGDSRVMRLFEQTSSMRRGDQNIAILGGDRSHDGETSEVTICILGVYGKGNLGDAAILRAMIKDITKRFSRAKVVVFCSNPDEVSKRHGVCAVSRTPFSRFFEKLRVVYHADAFVLGGGTLLCDDLTLTDDISASTATLIWPVIARVFGVPIMAFGQGLGPAEHLVTKIVIRLLKTISDVVTLRDNRSVAIGREVGGRKSNLLRTSDPAITAACFEPNSIGSQVNNRVREYVQSIRPYTLICLRRPKRGPVESWATFYESFARAVAQFYQETGSKLVLFPMQISTRYPDDREVLPVVSEAMLREGIDKSALIIQHWGTIEEGVAIIQGSELVLASRLHALLLAARAGVAVFGISYEDKVEGCLDMIGRNPSCTCVPLVGFDINGAGHAMIAAWKNRTKYREQIMNGINKWAQSDPSNIEILAKILESRK
jgi:polysaccharide pyruvyl transferase CsaB